MTLYGARHLLEHELLPQWFFKDQYQFLTPLAKDPAVLFRIFDGICQKEGVKHSYKPEQFMVEPARVMENVLMMKITFPKPEWDSLCYCAYMFFDAKFDKVGFYTIEKGNVKSGDEACLCGWTKDREHVDFGTVGLKDNADFIRCAKLYLEQ